MKKITIRKTKEYLDDTVMLPDGTFKNIYNIDIHKLTNCCWFLRHHTVYNPENCPYLKYEKFELEYVPNTLKCYLEDPKFNKCNLCFDKK